MKVEGDRLGRLGGNDKLECQGEVDRDVRE